MRLLLLRKQLEKFLVPTSDWVSIPPPTITDLDEEIDGKLQYEFAGGEMAACPVEAERFVTLRKWLEEEEEEEEEEEQERFPELLLLD